MVHGSGPLDRDGNKGGMDLNIFNQLAHSFAGMGFVSYRYDKRGCGESAGDLIRTGHYDLVADAISCLDALSHFPQIDENKMFVLGNSEGALIAPQLFLVRNNRAGIMLLCPFVQTLTDILVLQSETMLKKMLAEH